MACIKNFNFSSNVNTNFTGSDVKTWLLGSQEFWQVDKLINSQFNIQGYKNINIHGLKVVGTIQTLTGSALGGVTVEDWGVSVIIDGQLPLISGVIQTPNDWSIQIGGNSEKTFELGKYNSCVKFESPFESVTNVRITNIKANGYGGQTTGNVNLLWRLNFIFDYSFEGE
jgi:hypothetical protein